MYYYSSFAKSHRAPCRALLSLRGTTPSASRLNRQPRARSRRHKNMGCALSFLSNAGPYITERDLDDANDLVPPRVVRTDLPYAALQNIQLLSSKGGSCDVYTAVLDGEPVAATWPPTLLLAGGLLGRAFGAGRPRARSGLGRLERRDAVHVGCGPAAVAGRARTLANCHAHARTSAASRSARQRLKNSRA